MHARLTALVLAAGASSRFGGQKLLADLDGRPVLQHVFDALSAADVDDVLVVLGDAAPSIEREIAWRSERRIRNPDPGRGLASTLRIAMDAVAADVDAALIVLGDQPALAASTIRALVARSTVTSRPVVVPRYAHDAGRNPVLIRRDAFELVRDVAGDRGLGPVLERIPDQIEEVDVTGANPDVDTPDDLVHAAAERWAARVRADREQVDRFREVADDTDFYAPVRSIFRADPERTGDAVLEALRATARRDETWIDIGAGAGRYALPLAKVVHGVIAVDASPGMLEALAADAAAHGIANVRTLVGRWPPGPDSPLAGALGPMPVADVALIAHVGYDIEQIVPFLDGMEAAARRLCMAVLMERQPRSVASPFWPVVHGEVRVELPGLPDLLELLRLRGRRSELVTLPREPRVLETREALLDLLRRQLWIASGTEKDARLVEAAGRLIVREPDGYRLEDDGLDSVGLVRWSPPTT